MLDATVLIVDDEELIRWALRERLKAEGTFTSICEDGVRQMRGR